MKHYSALLVLLALIILPVLAYAFQDEVSDRVSHVWMAIPSISRSATEMIESLFGRQAG